MSDYIRASNGDGEAVRAIVVTERLVGHTLINVDSVLNWPTKFIATSGELDFDTGLMDEDTLTVFYGSLDGTMIHIDEYAPGYYDKGHQPDEVIVIKPTTAWADEISEKDGLPSGGTTGQALVKKSDADGDVEWGSGGGVSIISKETPGGAINGTNKVFTTALPYVGGSLQVYVNGLAQSSFVTETDPAGKSFTLDVAPASGDNLSVAYQFASSETGNADTLDGYHASAEPMANTIPVIDGEGKLSVPGDIYTGDTKLEGNPIKVSDMYSGSTSRTTDQSVFVVGELQIVTGANQFTTGGLLITFERPFASPPNIAVGLDDVNDHGARFTNATTTNFRGRQNYTNPLWVNWIAIGKAS